MILPSDQTKHVMFKTPVLESLNSSDSVGKEIDLVFYSL